jgi:hypothetical protein
MFEPADVAAIGQGPERPRVLNDSQKWLKGTSICRKSSIFEDFGSKRDGRFPVRLSLNLNSK